MIVDLHGICKTLKGESVLERSRELAKEIPGVHLVAVGGFPIVEANEKFLWCGNVLCYPTLREHVKQALGFSGVLTYTNKSDKTLDELGDICKKYKHLWGYHWINATLVFAEFPSIVELSFTRDGRFYSSWPIGGESVFALTAGLKEWIDYLAHSDDTSFDKDTRKAMKQAQSVLEDWLI